MTRGEKSWGRFLVVAVPYTWLLVLFLVPFAIVLKISFSDTVFEQPPYEPAFDLWNDGLAGTWEKAKLFTTANYKLLVSDSIYIESYLTSLVVAGISTIITLFVAYPVAYGMARAPKEWRPALLMFVILPFWTSFLIRVYAWIGILAPTGLLNQFLINLGVIDEPLIILGTNWAVMIGIVYTYLPFMVLPLYASLEKLDNTLLEAASDLGCPPTRAFWTITFPLSIPGVIAGCFLVFIPAVGEFVIPDLLGGSDTVMIGRTLWDEFTRNRSWPITSAVAIVLLLFLVVPIVIFQNNQAKVQEEGR